MDVAGLFAGVESHAKATGLFGSTSRHEPKRTPGKGLTLALWVQEITPIAAASGLAATSGRVEFRVRIYQPMLREPVDAIDPDVLAAVDKMMTLYSGDFTLGDRIRNVDLLGQHGAPLQARAGYLEIGGTPLRVMDVWLPLIINDLWGQAP
jgi:hypothetical protein